MKSGDAFLLVAPGLRRHLFFILTDPDENGEVAMANFTTSRPHSDTSCPVSATEHPWLVHESVVSYQDARLRNVAALQRADKMGVLRHQADLSEALLLKIREAGLSSNRCPRDVKAAIQRVLAASQ